MNTNDVLDHLVEAIGRSRDSGISPFREYLEAPPLIVELYRAFGRKLNQASDAGRTAEFAALLDDLELAIDKARTRE